MFIPRGKTIHENLATSYVRVDALATDLCEGGFSGILEVVLRDADFYVVVTSGILAAVIENHEKTHARISLAQLAERSSGERGRLSVQAYPTETARALAGRINAQTLYAGLSTEFTDLERMVSKLAREPEREWFVEVNTESGLSSL